MLKHNLQRLIVLAVLAIAGMARAYAWDSYGHMLVACVAYQNLTPQTAKRANELVQLNPNFTQWSGWVPAGVSSSDSNMIIFMLAATWPDEIKTESGYKNDGSQNGDRPDGSPAPSANTGYTDKLRHKYWHFIDNPFTQDGSSLPPLPTPNAQERIALFRGVLASNSDDQLKSYDLVWLLHLVGDVHQPLHCSTRVTSTQPQGDSGGNLVKLHGSPKELHAFWDDVLGAGKEQDVINSVINSAKSLPAADPSLACKTSEKDWVAESIQLSTDTVYKTPIAAGSGPFTLTTAYKGNAKSVAQARVALAGQRLANLLNAELK